MIPASFAYVRPASLEEALAALADPDARALAGGQSLLPAMKVRLARPSTLVDLRSLGLGGVEVRPAEVSIGATATYDETLRALAGVEGVDALRECLVAVGDLQVRNAGTVGGSLAHGDPASDLAAAALALGARILTRSAGGAREILAEELFLGPFTTALGRQELATSVVVPRTGPDEGSAYASVADRPSGYPLAGAAVRMTREGDRVASCRIGVTGLTAAPQRLEAVEERAVAEGPRVALSDLLAGLAVVADDVEYRRQLAAVVLARAIESAWSRAGGTAS